ncbi:midnolin homolog isoform X1 [Cimex lectularius]|uniref:Ubiquitin-like domain-containing protein n=1 Tax=Cimex lectularius TaxID=79782 RepID=A0A8I6S6Y1_CIMLE|nr:midnolin homolog isoform X1 [Cimex lectularius]XP_014256895.1 midnolin homolog isoform X1 [Cimex lectularius]
MDAGEGQCDCGNGCGCDSGSITISVTPTTGGQFELAVTRADSIESLKKLISKRLKVPKERICLLHRERQLREGTIQENQLINGSRLTLLPSVETGLLAQRPEQSVMQALESLNDSQVNDFLSGKAPLNLTMRLGDHMMLIQLQLSTVAPSGSAGGKKRRVAGFPGMSSLKPPPQPPPPQPQAATSQAQTQTQNVATNTDCACDVKPVLDTKALAEASRNLTQTLKQLSSEVLTSKSDSVEELNNAKRRQGAIIESMHHHGKGVYSGTFSGTLNPALQDRFGRPKRDISTIIHILNDLLCATPQYRAAAQEAAKPQPQAASSSSQSCSSESSTSADRAAESDENRATRGKMERLRLVLGQRRERRRAMRSQPYPTGHDHVTA